MTWLSDSIGPKPTAWTEHAWIKSAEYPIGRDPVSLIDVSAYLGPSGTQLLAATYVPAGAVVRVTIMAEHELSATADTIPARHRLPVAQYAAHLLCHQLATHYSAPARGRHGLGRQHDGIPRASVRGPRARAAHGVLRRGRIA
ncbi:hypothetical protein GO496_04625 [Acidovorax citrulli]|nr:hypothetical protein [Paracidovorax citrulli]